MALYTNLFIIIIIIQDRKYTAVHVHLVRLCRPKPSCESLTGEDGNRQEDSDDGGCVHGSVHETLQCAVLMRRSNSLARVRVYGPSPHLLFDLWTKCAVHFNAASPN